jgi:hypothetical protein
MGATKNSLSRPTHHEPHVVLSSVTHIPAAPIPSAFTAMRQGRSDLARASGRVGRAVPTIVFHGDRDTTVNPVNGDQVIAQSKAAADLRTTVTIGEASDGIGYTCTVQTDEDGRSVLEQWVLHGAGHAWSDGSTAGSYTEPRGPDASREMMRFFLQCPPAGASRWSSGPTRARYRHRGMRDMNFPRGPGPFSPCRESTLAVPAGSARQWFHSNWEHRVTDALP